MPEDWRRGLQPSSLELRDFAAHMEWQTLSKDQKIAHGLDDLLAAVRHHARSASMPLDIIRQIEALRKLIDEVM